MTYEDTAARHSGSETAGPAPPAPDPTPGDPEPIVIRMPVDIRSLALTIIAGIALVLFLRHAQAMLIPIVLGALLFYVLDPIVDRLEAWRLPRALGAALVLLAVTGGVAYGFYALSGGAVSALDSLPDAVRRIRGAIVAERPQDATPVQTLKETAREIDEAAAAATGPPPPDPRGLQPVRVVQTFSAADYLRWGSLGVVALAGQAVMIVFLCFFLLVANDLYKRKLVKIAPTFARKRITVEILDEISHQIERFLFVQILTSAIVGIATGIALWWAGLDQPVLWGLAAGILRTIPYFGPILVSAGIVLVGYLQFESLQMALWVSFIALVITSLEGWLLTPALIGRAARINPAAIFIGIIFWSWMWGVWGLLLAVPMLMMIKAVCDRVEELQAIGELLGDHT